MVDISNKRKYYTIYSKKKSNWKKRIIYAPNEEMKGEQLSLSKKLISIYDPPSCVYGFIKGKNVADLANNHTNKDWIITIDLKDFFPSITKNMVLSLGVSEYESEIATYNDKLVQGSPCAPIISNLVFRELDDMFNSFFSSLNIIYTRYVDDITLSGYNKPSWSYVNYIEEKCKDKCFKLNRPKTKFMFKNQRQEVLGVVVNNKVSIDRKARQLLRAKIHNNNLNETDKGTLSYINSINKNQYNKLVGQ